MSSEPRFAEIFIEACRAKNIVASPDVTMGAGLPADDELGKPLLAIGSGDGFFLFWDRGVDFRNGASTASRYSWDELSFILPDDVSIVGDKLQTFYDIEPIVEGKARRIGRVASRAGSALAVCGFLYYMFSAVTDVANAPTVGGLILGTLILLAVTVPFLLCMGLVTVAMALMGRPITACAKPLIRLLLARHKGFPNGITVVNGSWVKSPWGLPTTEVLDLLLLGVKLRRRGIA